MTDDRIRAQVRGWLAENWDPAMDRKQWAHRVFDAGWSAPSWEPRWGGRGLADAQSRIVAEEFAAVGARGSGQDRSDLLACTLHDLGTDEQKQRLIPPSVRGETRWCLLYSEPGAGSDLAGLRTRASVMNTSLNSDSPVIWWIGRTSTPGWRIGKMKKLIPRCLGTSQSVRATSSP